MTDWYRNKEWNTEAKEAFFAKLGRARSSRDQYVVIQAVTLVGSDNPAVLELVEYYFDTRTDDFHDVRAIDARAQALYELGRVSEALADYRLLISLQEDSRVIDTRASVTYPFLVATNQIREEFDRALETLANHPDPGPFPVQRFMWHAAKALVSGSSTDARLAIEAAGEEESGFQYHEQLGLVGDAHNEVIRELRRIGT
jgi:tetratricopeptide (TPR) repeat protein